MDSKSAVFMDKNGKNNKYTRHVSWGAHFLRNGEKFKMHNIYWFKGGTKLAEIATKNVGYND